MGLGQTQGTGNEIRDRYRRFFENAFMPKIRQDQMPSSEERIAYAAEFVANHLGQIDEKLGRLMEIANHLGQIDEKLGRHIEIMERKTVPST